MEIIDIMRRQRTQVSSLTTVRGEVQAPKTTQQNMALQTSILASFVISFSLMVARKGGKPHWQEWKVEERRKVRRRKVRIW